MGRGMVGGHFGKKISCVREATGTRQKAKRGTSLDTKLYNTTRVNSRINKKIRGVGGRAEVGKRDRVPRISMTMRKLKKKTKETQKYLRLI